MRGTRRQDRPALRHAGRRHGGRALAAPRRVPGRQLARVGLKAEIVVADANEWQPKEPFDAVLLDAPCTATGTIRRHPDIPWAKEPADVARLADAQAKLLRSAARLTKPGGAILYAVCSLQPEEGPQLVEAALAAEDSPFERDPIRRDELRGLPVDLTVGARCGRSPSTSPPRAGSTASSWQGSDVGLSDSLPG